jgi:hypothetical protein
LACKDEIRTDFFYLADFILKSEFEGIQWWGNNGLSKWRKADNVAVDVGDKTNICVVDAEAVVDGGGQVKAVVETV